MIRPPSEQEDNEKGVRKASRKSAIGRSHHTNNRKIVRLIGPPIANNPCFGGGKDVKECAGFHTVREPLSIFVLKMNIQNIGG